MTLEAAKSSNDLFELGKVLEKRERIYSLIFKINRTQVPIQVKITV
jgi:hypothetical protein